MGVDEEVGSPTLPPEEVYLLADVLGDAEVIEGEDVEQRGQLPSEVVEVAGHLGVPQQKPEPARLGAVLEEELGPIDEDVELPKAERRRGGKPGWVGVGGLLEGLQEGGEDPEPADEGRSVAALERDGGARSGGGVRGEGSDGTDEGGVGEVAGDEERAGEGVPQAAGGDESHGGAHRAGARWPSGLRSRKLGSSSVVDGLTFLLLLDRRFQGFLNGDACALRPLNTGEGGGIPRPDFFAVETKDVADSTGRRTGTYLTFNSYACCDRTQRRGTFGISFGTRNFLRHSRPIQLICIVYGQ